MNAATRPRAKLTMRVVATLGVGLAAAAHAAAPAPVRAGEQAFLAHCGKCHLERGTGTFMLGRRLGPERGLLAERTDLRPEYVRYVVRNGVMSMPWITRVETSDADLEAIVEYLTRERPE